MSETFDWTTLFAKGESPYFAMFRCGLIGVPIQDCIDLCSERGIPLRDKDIRSWKDGDWNRQVRRPSSVLDPLIKPRHENAVPFLDSVLDDFDRWPDGWNGTDRRWFPCNEQNMPMQKWGYTPGYAPNLYERHEAIALSPIGWVGQNLYAQPFIVIDIDGDGHGVYDTQVIEFGERYKPFTETWENPLKPGSFHLYFATDRQIPINHFPYAKIDLMGNQKNAAVYTKNKAPNGKPRACLTTEIWEDIKRYVAERRRQREAG